jgi:hypothetical protein
MTMPYERYRAIHNTREFLMDLLDPRKTPRVPKPVRQAAARCLRHYPMSHDMEQVARKCPATFGTGKCD